MSIARAYERTKPVCRRRIRPELPPTPAAIAAFRQLIPAPGQQALVVITEVDMREHRKLGSRDNLYFARRYAGAGRSAA